jgi:hypothetical protein
MEITIGEYRKLTKDEKCKFPQMKYVVTKPFELRSTENKWHVCVPVGFLTDGSSGGPDLGCSWMFHDLLYCRQMHDNGRPCSRAEADCLMSCVLKWERRWVYYPVFNVVVRVVPCLFARAWRAARKRGVLILDADER